MTFAYGAGDGHGDRHGDGAAHEERHGDGEIDAGDAARERLRGRERVGVLGPPPAHVERAEADAVPGLDREHGG